MLKAFAGASSLPIHPPQNLTVATTGASGSLFLKHFLLAVERDSRVQTVNFIASDSALRVMAEEFGDVGKRWVDTGDEIAESGDVAFDQLNP